MVNQKNLDRAYMNCAVAMSELSSARRKKVGAIVVQPNGGIIAEGYNGTPSGFDNFCEHIYENHRFERMMDNNNNPLYYVCARCKREYPLDYKHLIETNDKSLIACMITKSEVLHAESNAISKVARSTNSSEGSTLYITLSPCFECAKLIIQAGITRVVYGEDYRNPEGIDLLDRAGIEVEHICDGSKNSPPF